MSYKEKPQIKLFAFTDNQFVLQAIIDDYQECSFEHNIYQAGQFTISINYNIPNSQLFQRGLFIQFGNNPYDFGEIYSIQDSIGEDGKGSQIRTITGYDARYILKRRVIKNMNSNGLWVMTAKGELCLRNLIKDQCGSGAEAKRQLPIENVIPASADAIGKEYSVSENFSNLYEVCKTIATQSEIGWRIAFNGSLTLEVYAGSDLSQTVRFDTNYESLANGEFSDSSESFSNAIYIGGKGQNDNRDIYEGEDGTPSGLDRFESWDNQSQMTTESEYEAEALSMLSQYGQTLTMQGNGLAKCPYIFREQYDIGDIITVAFSGKSAVAQILSVTEHWAWGNYDIQFSFGKPQNNLAEQLQLMLRQIQKASEKASSTDSVRWYTLPTDSSMPKADVTYNTIGFTGNCASGGSTFKLYLDNEKTGAKTYHIYFKQLGGGNLTLTTGKAGATDLVMNSGTYVAIIYVDENGNITSQGATATNAIQAGNYQPLTSDGATSLQPVDTVTSGNMHSVTSNAVYKEAYSNYQKILQRMGIKNKNNFYGMTDPYLDDTVWIRTTSQGLIPYQSGGAGSGHGSLGTSSWYFKDVYTDRINGYGVRSTSIGGSSSETSNYWTYVKKSKFTANSGYIIYSNGLIIQWGKQNANYENSNGPWYYALTSAFSTTPIVICQRGGALTGEVYDGGGRESNIWNVTKSSFYFDSNVGFPGKNYFWYIAIGY